jgi:hypothetical protein
MKHAKPAAKAKIARAGKPPRAATEKNAARRQSPQPARPARRPLEPAPEPAPAVMAPRPSKQAAVIALLRRPEGVTVGEIVSATGWQPHTVRGLFSGTLKKKLGLGLNSAAEAGRGRVYRIVEARTSGEAKAAG